MYNATKSEIDENFIKLYKSVTKLKQKHNVKQLTSKEINELLKTKSEQCHNISKTSSNFPDKYKQLFILIGIIAVCVSFYLKLSIVTTKKCAVRNNYFIMEITRPISNCDFCKDIKSFKIFQNITKEGFQKYAYTSQPMVARNAVSDWPALKTFNFTFFKNLYQKVKGALDTVEEECQFFPFRTEFLSLRDVFQMPESRANMSEGLPWYIGWSNCNYEIASELRKHYSRPYFLPTDSESSAIDWIFIGYSGHGASMHLDYVHRPSWQAQISGSKHWQLIPPPECEQICHKMNVTVYKGDIVLINTNVWYHTTLANPGSISITIGSEYD